MYRFEKDDLAAGLIYNSDGSNSKKWIDEILTLKFAVGGMETATLAATAFSCFMLM